MDYSTAFEKAFVRELKEEEKWNRRRRWSWLMLVPTPVIILQWVALPVPMDQVPGNYMSGLVYVMTSWAALCAAAVATAAPEEHGAWRRIITGLLLWLGVTGLNGTVLSIVNAL